MSWGAGLLPPRHPPGPLCGSVHLRVPPAAPGPDPVPPKSRRAALSPARGGHPGEPLPGDGSRAQSSPELFSQLPTLPGQAPFSRPQVGAGSPTTGPWGSPVRRALSSADFSQCRLPAATPGAGWEGHRGSALQRPGPGAEGQPLAGLDVNQADPELGSAHGPVPLEGRA